MSFSKNCEQKARDAMMGIRPELSDKYSELIRFLAWQPDAATNLRGRNSPQIGSDEYIEKLAYSFANSRDPRRPSPPQTVPDEVVSVILNEFFDVPADQTERVKNEHMLSMAAENLVGDLLERYLAYVMEDHGWIWCSGTIVKAVDFVRPLAGNNNWELLQVKNRDNSENSSSSAIRKGTEIKKWFRTFSRRNATNWAAFPCDDVRNSLSESAFQSYVRVYLKRLRGI
ncbi:SinI family restriction endonuclease [Asticcacaulis sp. SL142]|uniref:SinI family restriction endonuclease n=1 Tax=Asticcacaulis sp. SL142 TaxID=2995155 RepID=UPI00226D1FFA|nr:SinI family restriction endonuclease [Asticcacaulis sp. SL142]WAC47843.1 SinI family restriction endonuclease [Asticcacaulis sp. SL142]